MNLRGYADDFVFKTRSPRIEEEYGPKQHCGHKYVGIELGGKDIEMGIVWLVGGLTSDKHSLNTRMSEFQVRNSVYLRLKRWWNMVYAPTT